MPASLPGFTKQGAVVNTTLRVQDQGTSLVPGFPSTMERCSQKTFTVQWRAAVAVTAGMTEAHTTPVALRDIPQPTTAGDGLIRGDGCSQPAFFAETVEDVAVSYQVWTATP